MSGVIDQPQRSVDSHSWALGWVIPAVHVPQCLRGSVLQVEEKGPVQHPLWTLRTKEEAQQFWEDEFGHLKTRNGASSAGQQNQKEKKQEQRVRSFVASGDSQPQAEAAGAATAVSGTAPTPDQARLRPSTSAPD